MVSVFVCNNCGKHFEMFGHAREHVRRKHSGRVLDMIDVIETKNHKKS